MAVPAVTAAVVYAVDTYKTNGGLIAAAHRLGYLNDHWLTLDMTYGRGTFWNDYRPARLITNDLGQGTPHLRFDMAGRAPFRDDTFDVTVCDPPYKLNGTPDPGIDTRYGVEQVTTRQERHRLMHAALDEAIRVTKPGGLVLYKCQDQVNSGRIWWQTRMIAEHAELYGARHRDSLMYVGGRPQPEGRSQQHARRNYSTLLVLEVGPTDPDGQGVLL